MLEKNKKNPNQPINQPELGRHTQGVFLLEGALGWFHPLTGHSLQGRQSFCYVVEYNTDVI